MVDDPTQERASAFRINIEKLRICVTLVDWDSLMKVRTQPWSVDELKRLGAIVAAGGSPVLAAAALNRKIIGCQAQARKMGTPFQLSSVRRRMIKDKCAAAERELSRD